jgi:hypothetical protein
MPRYRHRPALECLEGRCLLTVITWTGQGADPNWNTAANWEDDQQQARVPGANDDVVFVANFVSASTVNQNFTIASLKVEAGYTQTITLVGDLKIAKVEGNNTVSSIADPTFKLTGAGTFILATNAVGPSALIMGAGTMEGPGTTVVEAGATFTLGEAATKTFTGRTIENKGTLNWVAGDIALANNATIVNTGTINTLTFDKRITTTDNSATSLKNQGGTLTVAVDPTKGTSTTIETRFFNTGMVDLLAGGGLLTIKESSESSGTYTVGSNSTLRFEGNGVEHTLASATIQGAGKAELKDNTFVVTGVSFVSNLEDTAMSTIKGGGTLTVTGTYTWNGSSWNDAGAIKIEQTGTLNASFQANTQSARNLSNDGTVNWSPGADLSMMGGAAITNNASGVFDIKTNQTIDQLIGTGLFTNKGTLKKSAGAGGTFTIEMPFRNEDTGSLDVLVGTLKFSKSDLQSSGATTVVSTLEVPDGYTVNGGSLSGGGSGTITGNLTVNGATTTVRPSNNAAPGTLTISGNYTQTGGLLDIFIDVNAGLHDQLDVSGTLHGPSSKASAHRGCNGRAIPAKYLVRATHPRACLCSSFPGCQRHPRPGTARGGYRVPAYRDRNAGSCGPCCG